MTRASLVAPFTRLTAFLIDYDPREARAVGPLPDQVHVERVDVALRLAPLTAITAFMVVQVIIVLFWHRSYVPYLVGLQVGSVALALCTLESCWRWRSRAPNLPIGPRFRALMTWVSLLAGLFLASIPIVLFADSDMNGRLVIASTCAGLIATGMCLATVPRASFAYVGPIVFGSFLALAMTGEAVNVYVALLLAFYALFIFTAMFHLRRLVTKRVLTQIELGRQQELTNLLLNDFEAHASDWLWETDADLKLQHISPRLAEVVELPESVLHGLTFDRLVGGIGASASALEESGDLARLFETMRAHKEFHGLQIRLSVVGEQRWWSLSGKPIQDCDGVFTGYRGVGSDITVQKRSQERLSHLATHDPLTDLPNRALFQQRLDALLAREPAACFAVMCLDLDEFKNANDAFGHAVGDALLKEVARRLQSFVKPGTFVARLAGDEFMVLHETADRAAVRCLAERIVSAVGRPCRIGDIHLGVGVSIGIALAPADGATDLVRRADLALYRTKREGRNGFRFYEAEMDERQEKQRALASDLRGALDRGEFQLHYQPQVDARTGLVCGFEALLRWNHPLRGKVPPSDFIPIAEETGVIMPLSRWALREACRVATLWPETIGIAVNLSPIQLRHSDVPALVEEALVGSGLAPERLELEITESVLLDAGSNVNASIARLRALNVRLALDDFGTGYSSLAYLSRIAFDKLKIDRSFITDLPGEGASLPIVQAIVSLAKALGMTVIAEGVENEAQHACLVDLGCDECQGYLFGPAMPAEAANALVRPVGERPNSLKMAG
ncbi:bifunctional diguanylate cyclase/phosphodiesterase [Aureimonas sp. AU20]|uniref:putative bifunctional diguanylate cyclase/phosphodiesterase n=1 Tax=Aureimonas sp. AU20 TaxID=1349819 RepID=UPI000720EAD5|nr:GGDEF and EAL domain-containing protein [Aureimonas sp. AU20]ALN72101.1 hypothetical protein M673_05200 [Aureimonas sp. AU20]